MNNIPDPFAGIKQVAYVDTVELFFRGYLPLGIRKRMTQVCSRALRTTPVKEHGFRLTVQKPSISVLMELDRWQLDYRATLSRFDIAVDFFPAIEQIEVFSDLIKQHLVLKWGKGKMHDLDHGTYWINQKQRKRRSNRDMLVYSDKPSKITGHPCVHLELKFYRAQSCKRANVYMASQLVDLDPSALFVKWIGWSDVSDKYSVKVIRQAVKQDRNIYRGKTTTSFVDRYRASIPRKVRSILERSGSDRAQSIKT